MPIDGTVRPVRLDDAAELLSIYAGYVRDTTISFEFEPPSPAEFRSRIERVIAADPWLVLERGGRIAGYAYASDFRARPAYHTTRETTVYVHPDHHRSGVGRALLEVLLPEIARNGARTAVAVIALPNDASVALHERLGFAHAGTLHEIARKFDTWIDLGFWELALSPRAGSAA